VRKISFVLSQLCNVWYFQVEQEVSSHPILLTADHSFSTMLCEPDDISDIKSIVSKHRRVNEIIKMQVQNQLLLFASTNNNTVKRFLKPIYLPDVGG